MDRPTIFDRLNEFLLVFLLIFTPLAYGGVQPGSIALVELTAALMMFFWVLKMLWRPNAGFMISPVLAPVVVLIVFASVQFFYSGSIYPWATKTEILKLIAYALIFFVALNTLKTRSQIQRVEILLITVGFFMSIFYLMRYFNVPAPHGFINPDHFSAYLGMIIPLSLGFFLVPSENTRLHPAQENGRSDKKKDDLWPLLIFFSVIMSAALFFTMSRGGMLSFIAALLFLAFLISKRRSLKKNAPVLLAIAGLIMLIIVWLGATPVVTRLLSIHVEIASLYFGGRVHIWRGMMGIIRDHPLFGTGLGTFNYIFPKYQPLENIEKHFTYAHTDIFELLSNTGTLGFMLVAFFAFKAAIYLFRRYRERHDPWVSGMSIAVFGSLASIFIHSFTDFNLHIPANVILLVTLLVLLISILNSSKDPEPGIKDKKPEAGTQRITGDAARYLSFHFRILKYFAALFVIGLLVIYGVSVVRPALADYYANIKPGGIHGLGAAIRLDPLNAEYNYQLGELYGKSGLYTLQQARYLVAVKLNPTNSEYHQSLAWVLGKKKKEAEARKEFEAAIALIPNYYYPYQVYARWLLGHPTKENIAKGLALYKKAVALNPALTREALTECRVFLGDPVQLLEILPGTKETDLDFLLYLLDEGNIEYAVQFAERFLKTCKDNAECYFWIAAKASHNPAYKWDFLKKYYLKAIALEPDDPFFRYWYASDLGYRKYRAESDKQLDLILQSHPEYREKIREFRQRMYS